MRRPVKPAAAQGLFARLGSQLFHILGGVLVELRLALLAAQFDFSALMGEHIRFAHFTEFFPGNHAGRERIVPGPAEGRCQ